MKHSSFHVRGFSYVEVLVAMFIIAIALVPAIQALHAGLLASGIHEDLTRQHYAVLTRMENLLAESYGNLLLAAQNAGNATTPSSYSDPAGQADRVVVYLSLYDADADPFAIADPNADGDNNVYTGSTADLLWLKVQIEKGANALQTLKSR